MKAVYLLFVLLVCIQTVCAQNATFLKTITKIDDPALPKAFVVDINTFKNKPDSSVLIEFSRLENNRTLKYSIFYKFSSQGELIGDMTKTSVNPGMDVKKEEFRIRMAGLKNKCTNTDHVPKHECDITDDACMERLERERKCSGWKPTN